MKKKLNFNIMGKLLKHSLRLKNVFFLGCLFSISILSFDNAFAQSALETMVMEKLELPIHYPYKY